MDSGCYELVDDYQKLFNSKTDGYMSKEAVFITLRAYQPPYTSLGSVGPQMDMGRNAIGDGVENVPRMTWQKNTRWETRA